MTEIGIICLFGGQIVSENGNEVYVGGTSSITTATLDISLCRLKEIICMECSWPDVEAMSINISYKFTDTDGLCKFLRIRSDSALSFALELSSASRFIVFSVTRERNLIPNIGDGGEETVNILHGHNNDISDDDVDVDALSDDHVVNAEDPYSQHFTGHIDEDNEEVFEVGENSEDVHGGGHGGSSSHDVQMMQPTAENWVDSNWIDNFQSRDEWSTADDDTSSESFLNTNMKFNSKDELAAAVRKWHIANSKVCIVETSTPKSIVFRCKVDQTNCSWSLRGSLFKHTGLWRISKLNSPHTCANEVLIERHQNIDCKMIVALIRNSVLADTGLKISVIQSMVENEFGSKIGYPKAWYSKQVVLESLYGTHEDAFVNLPRLLSAMAVYIPGTVYDFMPKRVNAETGVATFGMMFWSFGPAIEGFSHCRPLISIDATHLYGKYNGKVLVAVSYDSNNGIYPLAFGIADGETNESWNWFLQHLRDNVTKDRHVCLMSDRHRAIINAVEAVYCQYGVGTHRFCARHIASNFNHVFKSVILKKQLYLMASTPDKRKFDVWYANLLAIHDGKYKDWISNIPLDRWALAYDGGARYGNMTTNLVEVFNGVLKGARALPLTELVKLTYWRSNTYFFTRRHEAMVAIEESKVWSDVVQKTIARAQKQLGRMQVAQFSREHGVFQVRDIGRFVQGVGWTTPGNYTVNVVEQTCECGLWQIYHHPCAHGMAALTKAGMQWAPHVDPLYSNQARLAAYSPCFQPVPDDYCWPQFDVPTYTHDPERWRTKRGRRKSSRIHNEMDAREGLPKRNNCSKCGGSGHNRKTCKSPH